MEVMKEVILQSTGKNSSLGIFAFFALANLLDCNLESVYPIVHHERTMLFLHRSILPRASAKIVAKTQAPSYIMWTVSDTNKEIGFVDHFVTLVSGDTVFNPIVERKPIVPPKKPEESKLDTDASNEESKDDKPKPDAKIDVPQLKHLTVQLAKDASNEESNDEKLKPDEDRKVDEAEQQQVTVKREESEELFDTDTEENKQDSVTHVASVSELSKSPEEACVTHVASVSQLSKLPESEPQHPFTMTPRVFEDKFMKTCTKCYSVYWTNYNKDCPRCPKPTGRSCLKCKSWVQDLLPMATCKVCIAAEEALKEQEIHENKPEAETEKRSPRKQETEENDNALVQGNALTVV